MSNNNDFTKDSPSVLEEIEGQLEEMLSKKKGEVEKELEEKINKEKEEAQQKINNIEKDFNEEKEALSNYQAVFSEFESKKEKLKKQLKEHLDKAIQYQTEIETLTGKTLEELKKMNEMNQELEKVKQEADEKATTLKKELEEKYGIQAKIPEGNQHEEMGFNLEDELSRLTKIKELLGKEELKRQKEEKIPETEEEEEPREEEAKSEPGESLSEEEEKKETGEASKEETPEERKEEKEEEEKEEKETSEQEVESSAQETAEAEESREKETQEETYEEKEVQESTPQQETEPSQEYFQLLENFRKSESTEDNGEVKYFQNDDKIILDGDSLISELESKIEEVKKLYIKLTQVESPREQFFIKQEIIKHQENLRKLILRSVRMCENESCSLPSYTSDVLNVDILKTILEKVSMENWSNQEDFSSFENYVNELKSSYQEQTSPHSDYLQSLVEELGIQ
ncbi:hypothetical protein KGY73_08275 [bacterium]|nr:hypothetical protein [bacterium]